jgi:hypothetical protein
MHLGHSRRNEIDIKPQEPHLQSDRFSNVNWINAHQDLVNPFLSISVFEQLAQLSQVPNHRLHHHPSRWGMINCIVAKVTQLHHFGPNFLSFG